MVVAVAAVASGQGIRQSEEVEVVVDHTALVAVACLVMVEEVVRREVAVGRQVRRLWHWLLLV
jgi:hypothetical protein